MTRLLTARRRRPILPAMSPEPTEPPGTEARLRIDARLSLFGAESRAAVLDVTARPRSQRLTRTLVTAGGALLVAPLVALVPPHLPWALGALGFGAWRARGEWRGDYLLHAFAGSCPRCGAPLEVADRYITLPAALTCYGCHAQPMLTLPTE
jgi:hypothetical protein